MTSKKTKQRGSVSNSLNTIEQDASDDEFHLDNILQSIEDPKERPTLSSKQLIKRRCYLHRRT